MARYRSRMALHPVNRIKHVVDSSGTLSTPGTGVAVNVISSTDTPTLADTDGCETGSKVNGIYLKVEVACVLTVASAIPNVYLMVMKNPGGNLTAPSAFAVGSDDNKRYVFHQEMINIENTTAGQSRILFNGVIAIPKGYRRNGPNDVIQVTIVAPSIKIAYCLQCHYKEFR